MLVLKRKGQLLPVTAPRAQFVRGLAGRFADSVPDMEAVSRRMREHLATTGTGASFSDPSVEPIGATKDAYFLQMKMVSKVGTWSSPVSAISALTVVNELPLSVTAYTTPKAKGESPLVTSRAYLRQIFDRN